MRTLNIYSSERGATLIVVMMILVVMTIIGVLGIKVALTSLNISTNSQINQLLGQTADTPLNSFANIDLSSISDLSGVIGMAVEESRNSPGKEFVFCYRPMSDEKFGASLGVTVLIPPEKNQPAKTKPTVDQGGSEGFCNLTSDFGSARRAVVTQVAVKIPTDALSNELSPGALLGRGTNLSAGTIMPKTLLEQQRIRVTTTSMMPFYGNANIEDVQQECLGVDGGRPGYISDNLDSDVVGKYSLAHCLADHGIPVNSQTQEFNLQTVFVEKEAP